MTFNTLEDEIHNQINVSDAKQTNTHNNTLTHSHTHIEIDDKIIKKNTIVHIVAPLRP